MDENDHTNETAHAPPGNSIAASEFAPPTLNTNRYLERIGELDIPPEAQREFLETLWNILVTIADLNLNIDPVQMLFADHPDFSTKSGLSTLDSPTQPKKNSISATATFNDMNAVLEES